MALDTYSALQTAIAGFLNRDDLTATIPDFITLAEAQLNRDVRHWRMETRATTDLDGRYVALPSDWVETIRLTASANYRALTLYSADQLERLRPNASTGAPQAYTHTAGSLELFPTPDSAYEGELLYYAKIPALSDSNTTNWLLDDSPDAYLYGSLLQSAPYLQDDARMVTWATLYSAAVARLNDVSKAAKWSGTSLRIRPPR